MRYHICGVALNYLLLSIHRVAQYGWDPIRSQAFLTSYLIARVYRPVPWVTFIHIAGTLQGGEQTTRLTVWRAFDACGSILCGLAMIYAGSRVSTLITDEFVPLSLERAVHASLYSSIGLVVTQVAFQVLVLEIPFAFRPQTLKRSIDQFFITGTVIRALLAQVGVQYGILVALCLCQIKAFLIYDK